MKTWSLLACVLISGIAIDTSYATTLTPLTMPTVVLRNALGTCIGTSFNSGDSINGTCQSVTWTGGRSPTYTYTVYATEWDRSSNLLANAPCGTFVSHVPALHTWTYQPGYSAANCYLPNWSGLTYILVGNQWYGYVTTSADGAFELLVNGIHGEVLAF
jgi:hypothetical protein